MNPEILRYESLESTMDESRKLAAAGHGEGAAFVVLADRQMAGRGRVEGRTWEGAAGASLFMTLCLPEAFEAGEAIPLRVALGTRNALLELHHETGGRGKASASRLAERLSIKWPNDIMGLPEGRAGGWRKLGGILCETSGGRIHAGIGLNLRPGAFQEALAFRATCIEAVTGRPCPDAGSLALPIARAVLTALLLPGWKEEYESAMWGKGGTVEFSEGHPESGKRRSGSLEGIDRDGRILLRDAQGRCEAFWSGEIGRVLLLESPDRE
jgi:biotin-(acetyl-CoA carboxylase) ligase